MKLLLARIWCNIFGHKYTVHTRTMKVCSCCGDTIISTPRVFNVVGLNVKDSDWRG